ncbi:MAG: tetratricopeptide repeat protein, partial [Candidatus Krumholzibacteria bacterium]|nr:tetratricopeptide repeat protein [Candidatus Krumholzibacteria bacterium]
MNRFARSTLAICTFWAITLPSAPPCAAAADVRENLAHYERWQLQWGATSLVLPAQLEYAAAVSAVQAGNLEEAESRLRRAIELDPGMPDAYFTLAKVDFRQFD